MGCPNYFLLRGTGILRCRLTRTLFGGSEKEDISPSRSLNRRNPFMRYSDLFVLAAQRTRPKTCRLERTLCDQLCLTAILDVIRKRSSLTPWRHRKTSEWRQTTTSIRKWTRQWRTKGATPIWRFLHAPFPLLLRVLATPSIFLVRRCPPLLSPPEHRDLFSLLRTNIDCSLLADELRERSAAHHYWSVLHSLQLAHDMALVADSTVSTVKQEGVRSVPLPTLLRRIQDAVSLSFYHLEMCPRSLTKAIQAKVAIREFLLGVLKPHTLRDLLLASDLIHPTVFALVALDAAIPVLKAALDANVVWEHAGCVPFWFRLAVLRSAGTPTVASSGRKHGSQPVGAPTSFSYAVVTASGWRPLCGSGRLTTSGSGTQVSSTHLDGMFLNLPPAVALRGRNRQERRGREFFRGASGPTRGCSLSHRQQSRGVTSGAPTSSWGPRRRWPY